MGIDSRASAHRPRPLFELQDVRSVATNAVKPHLNHPSILLAGAIGGWRRHHPPVGLQDVGSVYTIAVKPHLHIPSILLSDGFRSLPERGFAAALTNIAAARSLRPCGLRGRAARVMRRRMERPGPSRRSDCAVGARVSKSRSLPSYACSGATGLDLILPSGNSSGLTRRTTAR